MLAVGLALCLALVAENTTTDVNNLVDQLGAPRFKAREAAEQSLFKLGKTALPALRAAQNSKDLEIKTRATLPTYVKLDLNDVTLGEALEELSQQSGSNVALNPDEKGSARSRRVTCKTTQAVPFWKAFDDLCDRAQVHPIPGAQVPVGHRDGSLFVYDGPTPGTRESSDFGPFRVVVAGANSQNDILLSQRRVQAFDGRPRIIVGGTGGFEMGSATPSRHLYLRLMVMAEPRLSISGRGMAKVSVAVDDRGQSMVTPTNGPVFQHVAGYQGLQASSSVLTQLDLTKPESAGEKIRLVRGTIPIRIASRRPDPLEVSLTGDAEKAAKNEEISVVVIDSKPSKANQASTIEILVTRQGSAARQAMPMENEPFGFRTDISPQQFEVLDADGNSLQWFPTSTFFTGEQTRMTLTIMNRNGVSQPARIRYHTLVQTDTEVPFEFRNVPMP